MSHYLDRYIFHEELAICKKKDELSPKAIKMFQKLSKEVSRDFYFNNTADREDAIATAMHDLFKYWRNFRENNIVQVKIIRNFIPGDKIIINIDGFKILDYVAGNGDDEKNGIFKIHEIKSMKTDEKAIRKQIRRAINYSIQNFIKMVNIRNEGSVFIYHDKIKSRITFMDKINEDKSIRSSVTIIGSQCPLIEKDRKTKKDSGIFQFKEPPNAFSYFTSIVRNACMKSIDKNNPKHFKKSDMISIDGINKNGGGFFNL